jgi:hypothetical protein
MIIALFVVLQLVLPLCNYKMWIDIVRGPDAISYLCLMARLNMMEEEFRAHRMAEHKRATYFAIRREMDHEEDKKEREEERAQKREKAHRTKEAFARGGEQALMKGKWPRLTQD